MSPSKPFLTALRLAIFSIIIIGLVSFVFTQTKHKIQENEHQSLLKSLQSLLATELYDNELSENSIQLDDTTLYRAYKASRPTAVIIKSTTHQGYSGDIQLLTALDSNGTLIAVRILNHQETPGLGDKIELKKSNWLLNFAHKTLEDMQSSTWAVKRDQGQFDQFTGATITPRAVVNEIKKVGLFFHNNKTQIFPSSK